MCEKKGAAQPHLTFSLSQLLYVCLLISMDTHEYPTPEGTPQHQQLTPNQQRELDESEQVKHRLEQQAGRPIDEIAKQTNTQLGRHGLTRKSSALTPPSTNECRNIKRAALEKRQERRSWE